MKKHDDFLVEIHTEELPPKALLKLGEAFRQEMKDRLDKANLEYKEIKFFATPRRLAVLVHDLVLAQPDQVVERKGPAKNAAFDANGNPTPACAGFARSCGVTPDQLMTVSTPQGEWMAYKQQVPGKLVKELLPAMVEQAATALPIPKRMRWGDNDAQFTRPIHSVIMLFGDEVVEGTILGYKAGRTTRGHRFHAPNEIKITHANQYEEQLRNAYVIADFSLRKDKIVERAAEVIEKKLGETGTVLISSEEFLNEVTGLVEWPVALCGKFDDDFLQVPDEVLISSMQDHQRYFPVYGANGKLLPYFVTMSNIESKNPEQVIHGNERVLRARLSDAAFFFAEDKKESLEQRVERLKGIVFQAKLGTIYDKAERVSRLAQYIAQEMNANEAYAKRAALLAKADLTTNMVGEFPELQGVMGGYYALHDGEPHEIAQAIVEQYMPRFSGDKLPESKVGQALAIADRVDTLMGAFSINQIPTGDKDPYGLRRAAVGIIRILIENKLNLDLKVILKFALDNFDKSVENKETLAQVLTFIQERLRAWYGEKQVAADIFAAVAALNIANLYDFDHRIRAVQTFKKLNEAESLSAANKRVSNILAKADIKDRDINAAIFESAAEEALAKQVEIKSQVVAQLSKDKKYDEVLLQLAELRKPVDDFFDQVMVMTEDQAKRENRILLLSKLRNLFLQVADIALLQ